MLRGFYMGGDWWHVEIVPPSSPFLVDRTGKRTVATTEPAALAIRVSSELHGAFLERVMVHECTHAAMHSYGVNERLHTLVPKRNWTAVEETFCNLVADYGASILDVSGSVVEALAGVQALASKAA